MKSLSQSEIDALVVEAKCHLKIIQENGDPESAHIKADDILSDVLVRLGLAEIVVEYEKVHKWYA